MNSSLVPQLGLVRVSDSPLTRKTKPTNVFLGGIMSEYVGIKNKFGPRP